MYDEIMETAEPGAQAATDTPRTPQFARAPREAASPPLDTCAQARMTARSLLEQRLHGLHHEARCLEALLKALPQELPEQADLALWDLALKARS